MTETIGLCENSANDTLFTKTVLATSLDIIGSYESDNEIVSNDGKDKIKSNNAHSNCAKVDHNNVDGIVNVEQVLEHCINQENCDTISDSVCLTNSDLMNTYDDLSGNKDNNNFIPLSRPTSCEDSVKRHEDKTISDDNKLTFYNDEVIFEGSEISHKSPKEGCLKRKLACELCSNAEAIYTCPGCELKTCSLQCVKEHKKRLGCSGERSKAAFVDKSEYGEGHLLNDYRFLEDTNRKLYGFKSLQDYRHGTFINRRTKFLNTAAYKRGIKLHMLSQALTKHKNNTSFYTIKSDLILWHIEWHFVSSNASIKDERVPESTILLDAARKWVNFVEHPEMRKSLKDYEKGNLDACRFLLKIECLPANRIRYFKLNPKASLTENLRGHFLVEYPTIFVIPPQYSSTVEYVLLSEDDLSFMEASNRQHIKHLVPTTSQPDLEAQLINPNSHIYRPDTSNTADE
ncbi:Box C/D snoRNA protein 1 [Bulinus truncatus]|nr:Box C/D snoRNA protein 1 [Bulinus truncatus]